jgi:hypothetical protein
VCVCVCVCVCVFCLWKLTGLYLSCAKVIIYYISFFFSLSFQWILDARLQLHPCSCELPWLTCTEISQRPLSTLWRCSIFLEFGTLPKLACIAKRFDSSATAKLTKKQIFVWVTNLVHLCLISYLLCTYGYFLFAELVVSIFLLF